MEVEEGTEILYWNPGEPAPTPTEGRKCVIIKREPEALRVDSNTKDTALVIDDSEDEASATKEAATSSPPVVIAPPQPNLQQVEPLQQQPLQQVDTQQATQLEEQAYPDFQHDDEDEDMDHDDQSSEDDWKPKVEGEQVEYKVGLPPQPRWVPPEFFSRRNKRQTKRGVKEEFEKRMKKRPWATDNDEISKTKVVLPPASLGPVKGSNLPPRPCWLRLRRKWLLRNFLKHLIGLSNIRYMRKTFASICHHQTTAWDCHGLCWQCYLEFDLPLCGLDVELECPFCLVMGRRATAARNERLRAGKAELDRKAEELKARKEAEEQGLPPPEPSKEKSVFRQYRSRGGLPYNVYTQEDADEWIYAKNLKEMPNPDWLEPNEPVGSCFPFSLIKPNQTLAQAINDNPEWRMKNYSSEVEKHNKSPRPQNPNPETPSQINKVTIEDGLLWGSTIRSEREEQLTLVNELMRKTSEAIKQREEATADSISKTAKKLKEVSDQLMPLLKQVLPKTQATQIIALEALSNLTSADIKEALHAETPIVDLDLDKPEMMNQLNRDQLLELVQKLISRAQQAEALQSRADSQRQSRASSVEQSRKTPKSQVEKRQDFPSAAEIMYRERKMETADWTASEKRVLNANFAFKEPIKSAIVDMLDELHELKLDTAVDWETRNESTSGGVQKRHYHPQLEPQFLAQYWEVITDLPFQSPFDLRVSFPAEFGYGLGLTPHLVFKPLVLVADVAKKFPQERDTLPVTQAEVDQLTRLAAATGSVNNIVAVANRVLSMRLEDVSTPLEEERKAERLLTSIVREGTSTTNKLVARSHILATSMLRRDAMIRGGVDPNTNLCLFAAPWSRNYNYRRTIDEEKYEQWVTETGANAQARQKRIVEKWNEVKERRNAWWKKKEQQRPGRQTSYVPDIEVVGTPVAKDINMEEQTQRLQDLEDLPELE